MDNRLPMWLGPPTKWAAKSTGPEIREGPRARLCTSLSVCLFVCSAVVGTFSLQGALVPSRGGRQGCYDPGRADIPILPGHPSHHLPLPHLSSWALGPGDSTHMRGVHRAQGQHPQGGRWQTGDFHPAVHGCTDPGPSPPSSEGTGVPGVCASPSCLIPRLSLPLVSAPLSVLVFLFVHPTVLSPPRARH